MGQLSFLIFLLLFFSGCVFDANQIAIKLSGSKLIPKNSTNTSFANTTITNVQIVNNQLIISGHNLNSATQVKVKNPSLSFDENFAIESISSTQIIANGSKAISFAINSAFDLILSNAYASSSFTIDFSLCNATLNAKTIDCSIPATDKSVLSYDATTNSWKPRQINGLNYIGAWDARSSAVPTTKPAGDYYIVGYAGDIGGVYNVSVGDWIVSTGSAWQKIDNSTVITSVFGRTGAVVAQKGDYDLNKLTDVDLSSGLSPGKVLKYDGTNWVPSDDLTGGGAGSVSTSAIADGAVTDVKIATVSASKITGTITSTQITDGTIVNADISNSAAIDYSKLNIPAGSIPYAKLSIADGDIPSTKISGLSTSISAVIEDANHDAETGKAPTENAVFDALALKLDKTGGTITSSLNVPTPILGTEAANKDYVDTTATTLNTSISGKVAKAGDTMSGDLTLDTQAKFKSGSYYTTVKGSGAAIGNYVLTLPPSAGSNGYILTTNGSGVTTWTNPASISAGSGTVDSAAIVDGTIVDADISGTAAIAQSKISGLTTALAAKEGTVTAGTTAQYYRGDKSWQTLNTDAVPEGATNLYYTNARVLGLALTGINTTTSGTIAATDSVLTAFGKTQKQIDDVNATITGMAGAQWSSGSGNVYRSTGNVGIGTNSPSYSLDVVGGSIKASRDDFHTYILAESHSTFVPVIGTIRSKGTKAAPAAVTSGTNIGTFRATAYYDSSNTAYSQIAMFASENWSSSGYGSEIHFETTQNGTTNTSEKMRLSNEGYLGIGISSPSEILHVGGNALLTGHLKLKDSTSNTISLAAPSSVTSYTMTLPAAAGTNGQVLSTTGSGNMTWTSLPAAFTGTASRAVATDAGGALTTTTVTATELGYVSGVTSAIQTQLNGKEPSITAGTTAQYLRGDKTLSTFATDVINSVLSTYTIDSGTKPTIATTDTVVGAFGKVQKFLNDINSDYVSVSKNQTINGTLAINSLTGFITVPTPVGLTDAANKDYVDTSISANGVWSKGASSSINYTAGNVGIGTTTPTSKLQVAGGTIRSDLSTTGQSLILSGSGSNLQFSHDGGANAAIFNSGGGIQFRDTDGTTNLVTIKPGGSVGIGTPSPIELLQLAGNLFLNKASGDSGIRFQNASGTSYWINTPNTNMLSIGGTGGLIPSTGAINIVGTDVGIGTTIPNSRLDVKANTTFDQSGNGANFLLHNSNSTNGDYLAMGWTGQGKWGIMAADSSTYKDLNLQPYGGNVGIGTTTPGLKLDVNGSIKHGNYITNVLTFNASPGWETGSDKRYLKITTEIPWADGPYVCTFIKGVHYDASKSIDMQICWYMYSSSIYAPNVTSNGSSTPTVKLANESGKVAILLDIGASDRWYYSSLQFDVLFRSTSNVSYFQNWTASEADLSGSATDIVGPIQPNTGARYFNGFVGIGTTSPISPLDVYGNGNSQALSIRGGSADHVYMGFYSEASSQVTRSAYLGFPSIGSNTFTIGNEFNNTGEFSIVTKTSGSMYSRLNITNSGNIGIGTTSPSYTLHVNGSVAGTSAYNNLSDMRFKKDIVNIPNALDKLLQLDGVFYNFKTDEFPDRKFSNRREMGVIAQTVEKVFPEAVSKDQKGFRSVAYSMLIAPIIEAIKEIKTWMIGTDLEISKNKRSIASLEEKNRKLEAENLEIKNALCDLGKKAFCPKPTVVQKK